MGKRSGGSYYNTMIDREDPMDFENSDSYQEGGYEMAPMAQPAASGNTGGGADAASTGTAAATGAAAGGPAGAAIMVGGQFLTNYLAAKAAEERQKRDMAMKNQEQYGQNQNAAIGNMMSAYARALR